MPVQYENLDMQSAMGLFRILGKLVDENYRTAIKKVRTTWKEFEKKAIALQSSIDQTALELYKTDKALAREFLTVYSNGQGLQSLEIAKKLIDEIYSRY